MFNILKIFHDLLISNDNKQILLSAHFPVFHVTYFFIKLYFHNTELFYVKFQIYVQYFVDLSTYTYLSSLYLLFYLDVSSIKV